MRRCVVLLCLAMVHCSPPSATSEDAAPSDGSGSDVVLADAGASDADADVATLLPLADFNVGTYGSANALFTSILGYGVRYAPSCPTDGGASYGLLVGMAYEIEAAAKFLRAGRGRALPGGESERTEVATTALTIANNALAVDGCIQPSSDAPGWGLDWAWDAFADKTTNPAYTNYAFETGMLSRSMVDLATELLLMPTFSAQGTSLLASARGILDVWENKGWSNLSAIAHPEWGFYWYSLAIGTDGGPNDAIPVYNTTALLSMAETVYGETTGSTTWSSRSKAAFGYLVDSLHYVSASDSYYWYYAGYNYPHAPVVEDISHAGQTEQWMRFGFDRGWLTASDATRIQHTINDVDYKGNPARLSWEVDGTSDPTNDWSYTPAAAMSIAAWGDVIPASAGGRVETWELARNIYFSAELQGHGMSLSTSTTIPIVTPVDALVLANLFLHRPSELYPDSKWVVHAGDANDETPPTTDTGGVRFHPAVWSAPSAFSDSTLPNIPPTNVRVASVPYAHFFVDLPPGSNDVLVSLVYLSSAAGTVEQWDGAQYVTLAPLPATTVPPAQETDPVFFRTTFRLSRASAYFDYEPTVPATNVLLRVTQSPIDVAIIEATPID